MDALSAKARSALDAICDTFVPGGDGLPSATELGVPDTLLGLVARNPRAAERKGNPALKYPNDRWAAPVWKFRYWELADTTSARRIARLKPPKLSMRPWMPE